jgi:glycosyltransferase involved in cell wall biosynthesis
MKILFLVGIYPPKICGIGDYTYKLKMKLDENNIETKVIDGLNWKTNPFKIYKIIKKYNPDIIHIQYPLTGLSAHILLLMCFLKYKILITAHEFAETHWTRKISMFIFPLSKAIIWTTNLELNNFKKYFPIRIPCKHKVIPIASNIPFLESKPYLQRDKIMGFFGGIRPSKGLEEFFELVELLEKENSFKIKVIGSTSEIYMDYFNSIKQKYSHYDIEWNLNLSEKDVAVELSKMKYIYLPFEDGASERRGSLLAAIGNGACVISTAGKYLTPIIKSSIRIADTHLMAKEIIENEEKNSITQSKNEINEVKKYYNWDKIINLNIDLYKEVLKNS